MVSRKIYWANSKIKLRWLLRFKPMSYRSCRHSSQSAVALRTTTADRFGYRTMLPEPQALCQAHWAENVRVGPRSLRQGALSGVWWLLWKEQGVGLLWSAAPAPTTAPCPGDMFSKKAGQLSTIFSWLTNTSFFKTVSNSTPPSLWSSDITTLSQGRQNTNN